MVTGDNLGKLLDFGIARLQESEAGSEDRTEVALTEAGAVIGTLGYMSPEQLRGKPLDERSDLFSLGAVLYEAIAGRPAFPGDNPAERIAANLSAEFEPLAAAGVPGETAVLLGRAMARDPERRYASAAAFLSDLRALGSGELEASLPDTLAIVAFRNLSQNKDDDWIGSGFAESLGADLARLPGVSLVPREKVAGALADLCGPAQELGRVLGCRWVLSGAYQRARAAPARDVPAGRRRHGGDRRFREGRRRRRRDVRDAGPALGFGRRAPSAGRRGAGRSPAGSAHGRLRALRKGPALFPPPREGIARPGAVALRGGHRRRRRLRSGPGRPGCRSLHALSLPDGPARARDRRELCAAGDRGRREPCRTADLARLRPRATGPHRRGAGTGAARHGARPRERVCTLLRRHLAGAGLAHGRCPRPLAARRSNRPEPRLRVAGARLDAPGSRARLGGNLVSREGSCAGGGGRKRPDGRRGCLSGRVPSAPRRSRSSASPVSRGSRDGGEVGLHVSRHVSRGRPLRARPHRSSSRATCRPRGPPSPRRCRTCADGLGAWAEGTCSSRRWPGSPAREGAAPPFEEGLALWRARTGHDFSFMWVCTDGATLLELARAASAIGRTSEAEGLFDQARAAGSAEARAARRTLTQGRSLSASRAACWRSSGTAVASQ